MTTTFTPPRVDDLPLGVGPRRWRHPVAAAGAAFVVGLPSTGVGAGIAARHLQKSAVSLTSAAGLVLLLAGLALLGYAAVVCWRLARRWYRLWFLPATLLTLLLVIPVAMGTALAVVPSTSLGRGTPASYGLSYADVTFRTADGVTLSAWLVRGREAASVVVLHGAGSTRTSTLPQAAALARHGYTVLMVDARGHGRSGGTGMDAGWYGDRDVAAATAFLRRQPGLDPGRVGLLGLSMGGEEAIGAAGAGIGVRAVVAEGATHRTAVDKSRWLPHGLSGALQRGMDAVTFGVADLFSPAAPPTPLRDAVRRSGTTRFLLIAAGRLPDERRAADVLRSAAPDRVQVWTVPRAGHTRGLATDAAGWEQRVLTFLDGALRP